MSDNDIKSILETFVANAHEFITITDANLAAPLGPTIEYANISVLHFLGYSARDFVGHPIGKFYSPEDLPEILAQMHLARADGKTARVETKTVTRTGKPIRIEITVTPIFNAAGELSHFLRVGRDVTARHRLDQERESTQRLLASVFGVIDQGIGVVDDAGRFVMINTAMTKQLGWSVFELMGKPWTTLIADQERASVEAELAAKGGLDQTCRLTTYLRRPDGSSVEGGLVATTILQPDQRRYRVITVLPKQLAQPARMSAAFEATLRKAMANSPDQHGVVAGKLQLIGLAEVRRQFGQQWPEVAERAFAIAERIIDRHLGPGDVFERQGDDSFIVCFSNLAPPEAQFKASAIGHEIRERLLGEVPEMAEARVDSYVAAISIDETDPAAMSDILGTLEDRLARERRRMEKAALDRLKQDLPTAQVEFQALRTETNQAAPILLAQLPDKMAEARDTLSVLGRNDYALEMETLLLTGTGERVLAELALTQAELIVTPVRMETLLRRRDADRWLQVARGLGGLGKQRIIVEIADLARDTARLRLSDLIMTVAALFKAVAFELPSVDPAFLANLPPAIRLVTIPLERLGPDDGRAQAATMRLVAALDLRRCRLIVKNVKTAAQRAWLGKAGVKLMAA